MALATLSIDLVAKLANFEESFSKATRIAEKNAAQIEARWAKVGAFTTQAFAALGGAAAGAALVTIARNSIDAIDALNDVADATGSTVENISALEDVALRTGGNLEVVQSSLIKFNAVLKDAKPGSGAEAALKAIGLNAEELRRIDPAEALKKTADALAGFADDGNKARLTQELFGKSLKEVAPFLKDLAAQGGLVATVTSKQAEEAEKFNKALFEMQANLSGMARAITSGVVPAINDLFDKFKSAREAFGGTMGALFRNDFGRGDFANAVEGLQFYRGELDKIISARADLLVEAAGGGEAGLQAQIEADAGEKRVETIKKQIRFYELLTKTAKDAAGAGRGVVNPNSATPSVPEIITPAGPAKPSDFDKLIQKIREKTAVQQAEGEAEKALSDAQKLTLDTMLGLRDGTIKLTQAQAQKVAAGLEEINSLERTNELRRESAKLVEDGAKAEAASLKAALDNAQATEQQVQAMRDAIAEIGLEARALADLQSARLEDAAARKEQLAASMQEAGESEASVAAIRKQAAALRDQAAAGREVAAAKDRQEVKTTALSIVSQTDQGQIDALTKQYGALDLALQRGQISTKQYAEGLDVLDAKFGEITKPIGEAQEKLSTFADQAQRNIESGLAGSFEKMFRGEFDSIGDLWADMLIKMASQAMAANLSATLFGANGNAGLLGKLWDGFLAGGKGGSGAPAAQADGGAWARGVQFYASGDVFSQATMFKHAGGLGVLGEAGPEAVMPLKRGADGKLGVAASGNGGMTVHLTISNMVGEFVTPSQVAQVAERTRHAAMAGIADAKARGNRGY